MQTSLAQFSETQSQDAFALQNPKLLKVRLDEVTVQAKLGSMVAYQGEVTFEHAGSGGIGRMLKKAMSENDFITVNGRNLLAFDAGIDRDIKRVEGVGAMMGGGLFNVALHGGWLLVQPSEGRVEPDRGTGSD